MTLNLEGISRKILYASPAEQRLYIAMLRILILGLIHLAYELEILLSYRRNFIQEQSLQKNPGGIYRIPASGNYHDDKVALYEKAGLSEPFSPDYIAHHIVTILTQIQWKCNLFEAKAIRKYHIEDVLKIMKNKLKKHKQNSYAK